MRVEIEEGSPDEVVIIRCPRVTPEIEALATRLRGDSRLPGTRDGVTHLIAPADVLYFESVDKRTFIYTADAVYETPLRLYEVEERTSDADFFRSSKAQIVNIAKITALVPDFGGRLVAYLPNDERLIISRHYAKQLKERLITK